MKKGSRKIVKDLELRGQSRIEIDSMRLHRAQILKIKVFLR